MFVIIQFLKHDRYPSNKMELECQGTPLFEEEGGVSFLQVPMEGGAIRIRADQIEGYTYNTERVNLSPDNRSNLNRRSRGEEERSLISEAMRGNAPRHGGHDIQARWNLGTEYRGPEVIATPEPHPFAADTVSWPNNRGAIQGRVMASGDSISEG